MDVLERFVENLSPEDFDYLNRNRAFAQQLLDHHSDLERANGGDAKAFERLARRAADDRLEEYEHASPPPLKFSSRFGPVGAARGGHPFGVTKVAGVPPATMNPQYPGSGPTPEQLAEFGAGQLPGSGIAEGWQIGPDLKAGRYWDAALKILNYGGDLSHASGAAGFPPGVAIGAVLKTGRAAQKAAKIAKPRNIKFSAEDRAWMELPDTEYQVNVDGLLRKYDRKAKRQGGDPRFANEDEIQKFIDDIVDRPDVAMPGTSENSRLVAKTGAIDNNRTMAIEAKTGRQKSIVKTLMEMDDLQLLHKIDEAEKALGRKAVKWRPKK